MVKTDPNLRKKMMEQRERTRRESVSINKSDWTKGKVRILPTGARELGRPYYSCYSKDEKKSITLPRSFGAPDPLLDYIEATESQGTKDAKEHISASVDMNREHWFPCILRGDEGTAMAPRVRAFRLPLGTYNKTIFEWMVNVDIGEDITDADEGYDVYIEREQSKKRVEWKVVKADACRLSKDKALKVKLIKVAKTFDVADHFFPFSLEDYETVFQALTNEELPAAVRKQLEKLDAAGGRLMFDADVTDSDEEDDDEETAVKKKTTKKKGKGVDDDEDEAPAKKSKAKKKAKDDDEDEEDEDDDDEDDEDDEDEDDEDDEDEDDDEDDDDEDEDEDEDEDDEDDDEDEAPAKKSKAKKKAKDDDEDEEDEDDEDDEDEDDDEDEEDEDDEDEDDEDEEAEEAAPTVRGGKSKAAASKAKPKASKKVVTKAKPKVKAATKVKPKAKVSKRIKSKR